MDEVVDIIVNDDEVDEQVELVEMPMEPRVNLLDVEEIDQDLIYREKCVGIVDDEEVVERDWFVDQLDVDDVDEVEIEIDIES